MPTILDYKSMAVYKNNDFSKVQLQCITKGISSLIGNSTNPQEKAIRFYTLNHLVSVIEKNYKNDVELGQYNLTYEAYNNELLDTGLQIFYYLLCICTREARHLSNIKAMYSTSNAYALWQDVKGGGGSAGSFLKYTSSTGTHGTVTIGELLELLLPIFTEHSWSSSFGGKAWGNITEQVRKYVYGECSLELLVDTAFTLSHNTGNIFNKGFIFSYDTDKLIEILDVQRSGQMPEYVNSKDSTSTTEGLQSLIHSISALEIFGNTVDWQQVMDLGSVKSYHLKLPKDEAPKPTYNSKTPSKSTDYKTVEDVELVTIFTGFTLEKVPRKKQPKGFMQKPQYEDMKDVPF